MSKAMTESETKLDKDRKSTWVEENERRKTAAVMKRSKTQQVGVESSRRRVSQRDEALVRSSMQRNEHADRLSTLSENGLMRTSGTKAKRSTKGELPNQTRCSETVLGRARDQPQPPPLQPHPTTTLPTLLICSSKLYCAWMGVSLPARVAD